MRIVSVVRTVLQRLPRRTSEYVALAVLLALMAVARPIALFWILAISALLIRVVSGRDRFLLLAALGAFGLRVILVFAFHGLSALDLPLLASVLTDPVEGHRFWVFSLDSPSYHANGVYTMRAWQWGIELPEATGMEYVILTGMLYALLGPHPLNGALWNGLFGALTVITGYRIAVRVAGAPAARITALAIAGWPSMLIWSTQLLKDSICVWLTLVIMHLTMLTLDRPLKRSSDLVRLTWLLALLFLAGVLMYYFRNHIFFVMIPAPAAFVLHALLTRERAAALRAIAACGLIALMAGAYAAARRVDLHALFSPPHPEVGYVNLGAAHQMTGNFKAAEAAYRNALRKRPDFAPAVMNLAALLAARGDLAAAQTLLGQHLAAHPKDSNARWLQSQIEQGRVDAVPPVAAAPPAGADGPALLRLTGPRSAYETGAREMPVGNFLRAIAQARWNYTATGGYSMIDPQIQFKSLSDLLLFLPRGLANLFLAPYPWQWVDLKGGTKVFKAFSAVEALLLYLLVVPLLVGTWLAAKSWSADGLYLITFTFGTGLLLTLVITNLGTFFRLRLEFLIPLFTLLGPGVFALTPRRWRPLLDRVIGR